jgi:hypothetical protein
VAGANVASLAGGPAVSIRIRAHDLTSPGTRSAAGSPLNCGETDKTLIRRNPILSFPNVATPGDRIGRETTGRRIDQSGSRARTGTANVGR